MNFDNILWDFDGVILDSMAVRDWGFRKIFRHYSSEKVEDLIKFHRENGGKSRYVKIRYFYENILFKTISEEKINEYSSLFSELMKKKLIDKKNLIHDSVHYIDKYKSKYNFHIVSGSDQEELRYLSKRLNISNYFVSIHGSPTPKEVLIDKLIKKFEYKIDETCLIGDSINDLEAAYANKIKFYGYNNHLLKNKCEYIDSFTDYI
tara:strand:- start:508 stop:1125 length:618 start_codon:yes stop_codon:yes gene_type:complete